VHFSVCRLYFNEKLKEKRQNKTSDLKLGPSMVVQTCNPNIQEVEVGGLRVQGQTGLHRKTLSLKINK
jgi:hypothetical protein